MAKKIQHGLETCEDCQKIIFMLVEKEPRRFNDLLRQCKKLIDKKYSAPRLTRHLEGLEGKIVKRIETTPQNVGYRLLSFASSKLRELIFEEAKNLESKNLGYLINSSLRLYRRLAFQEMIIVLETFRGSLSNEQIKFELLATKLALKIKFNRYRRAMANRTESEYLEAINNLKNMLQK